MKYEPTHSSLSEDNDAVAHVAADPKADDPKNFGVYEELFESDPRYAQSRLRFFKNRSKRCNGATLSRDELYNVLTDTLATTGLDINTEALNIDKKGMVRKLPKGMAAPESSDFLSEKEQAISNHCLIETNMAVRRYLESTETLDESRQ